jgi:hypothetical protein
MSTWSFVGASIDRYLRSSESITHRSWSTSQTARRFLIIILILSVLIFGEIFYCFEASVPNVPVACFPYSPICQLYNEWMNIMYNIMIPNGFMAGFGILTLLNVRKQIIHPTLPISIGATVHRINHQSRMRKIDQYLRRLLLVQVSFKHFSHHKQSLLTEYHYSGFFNLLQTLFPYSNELILEWLF